VMECGPFWARQQTDGIFRRFGVRTDTVRRGSGCADEDAA
jgi:hypothetical protein